MRKPFRKSLQKAQWKPCLTPARQAMVLGGLTYVELARRLSTARRRVSVPQVVRVIHGYSRRPDLRRAIAKLLGQPVSRLWPGD